MNLVYLFTLQSSQFSTRFTKQLNIKVIKEHELRVISMINNIYVQLVPYIYNNNQFKISTDLITWTKLIKYTKFHKIYHMLPSNYFWFMHFVFDTIIFEPQVILIIFIINIIIQDSQQLFGTHFATKIVSIHV